jgi:hypothetical protein
MAGYTRQNDFNYCGIPRSLLNLQNAEGASLDDKKDRRTFF